MDLASLISSFATGTYTVTRRARGSIANGKVGSTSDSTVTITASVSPSSGSDVVKLPEGRRTNETRTIFTTTLLKTGGQGEAYEADQISIGGETYEVMKVETWIDSDSGDVAYKCIAVAMR